MASHAMLTSTSPPSFNLYEPQELSNDISLKLCHGWSVHEITAAYEDDMDGDISDTDLPALIEEVRAEYARLITGPSEDAQRIDALRDALSQRDLSFSFDEGWDKGEAAEEGADRATDAGHRGYAYCTTQDVDGLIHSGELHGQPGLG